MSEQVTRKAVCVPSDDVVAREIEGDIVIVPLTAGVGDANDEPYTLNATGRAVWRQLHGARSLADVVARLTDEFEAPAAQIEADVVGFAAEMVRRGILATRG